MKILVKITSLALLTLCLQVDAANFKSGTDGFLAACQVPGVTATAKFIDPFTKTFGVGPKAACTPANVQAAKDIKAFVNDPTKFNQGTQTFLDDATVQDFVDKFSNFGHLLGNRAIFSTPYLDIAGKWLEAKVKSEAQQATALTKIAASVADLTGSPTPPLTRSGIEKITSQVKKIDTEEKKAREFLNELRLTFNTTTKKLEPAPMTLFDPSMAPVYPKEVYQVSLEGYIQTTFARRLQNIMPNFSLLPLFNTPTPLNTKLLSKTKKSPSRVPADFYEKTELQAAAVIKAMAEQIRLSELTLRNEDPLIGTPVAGLAATLENWADQAVATVKATDGELIRVAKIAPAFTLPAGTLDARAAALLGHLSAAGGGGGAAITAYLDSLKIPNPLTTVTPVLTPFQTTIDTTRTALGYGTTATGVAVDAQFEAIRDILSKIPTSAAGATAEDRVKDAITYLTKQLYTSFMWLTKAQNGGVAIPGVPAYTSGGATDVAAATQNRIEMLIKAIETLHAEKAALTTSVSALRAGAGAAGAETDPHVIAVIAQVEKLAKQLNPCDAVHKRADATAKLPLLPVAVTQMTEALADLSNGAAGLPAANGAALAKAIRDHIRTTAVAALPANPAVAQLATATANLALAQAEVTRLTTEVTAAQTATADETAKLAALPDVISQALIDQKGGGMFTAFAGGFNLTGLTADAPTAASTLADVGNYLRQCALAANELKELAISVDLPTTKIGTMKDLITKSGRAIRSKFLEARIPQAVIDGHNESVQQALLRFNNIAAVAASKKVMFVWITSLNDAANAIGAGALTITLTDQANGNVIATKKGITDTTTATAA